MHVGPLLRIDCALCTGLETSACASMAPWNLPEHTRLSATSKVFRQHVPRGQSRIWNDAPKETSHACRFAYDFTSIGRHEGFARGHVAYSQDDIDAFVAQVGAARQHAPREQAAPGLIPLPGTGPRPPYTPLGLAAGQSGVAARLACSPAQLSPLPAAAAATGPANPAAASTPPLRLTPATDGAAAVLPAATPAQPPSISSTPVPSGDFFASLFASAPCDNSAVWA